MSIEISEWFVRITDLLQESIVIVDADTNIIYINKAYENFIELKKEEVIGRKIAAVRPKTLLPEVMKWGKPLYNMIRHSNNRETICDFIPIMCDKSVIGGMVVIRDINLIGSLTQVFDTRPKIKTENVDFSGTFRTKFSFDNIIGAHTGLKNIVSISQKAAFTDSSVLISGESGTGKEIIAQSIHGASNRKDYPFVDINCAALPEGLLESELFGYEAGAFTGGNKAGKKGLFEIANGGTIFLDEISEMPLNLQVKLLRVLQERTLRKIGGRSTINLDVRIIAATNKDLRLLIDQNLFRQDLYFRLAVFVIDLPPLRERKDDIPLFINYYIEQQQKKLNKLITISKHALNVLCDYSWPGNVRELKNVIEYLCTITDETEINLSHLPPEIIENSIAVPNDPIEIPSNITLEEAVERAEKDLIEKYLAIYGSSAESKRQIADKLGVSIATFYNKLKKYNISL